jgi:hypothetical protein
MITLVDFLSAVNVSLNRKSYKVHLATYSGTSPLQAFYKNKFRDWQEIQSKKNFECDMVISLIWYEGDIWLFAGVYKVLGRREDNDDYIYQTELIPGQVDVIGRVMIHHKRSSRASYLWGEKIADQFTLHEVKPKRITIEEFPGNNVALVSNAKLKTIVNQLEPTWYGALANIKGVYLITDVTNGKHYVGSAYGDDGIWSRWSEYITNGHGGNKDLKKLLKEQESDYVKNFQYCLLEIADMKTPDKEIIKRESYWKDVLKSREFGYNAN